jgi:hypothetical protein
MLFCRRVNVGDISSRCLVLNDILNVTWLIIYGFSKKLIVPCNPIHRRILKLFPIFHLVRGVHTRSTVLLGLLSFLLLVPLTS